MAKGASTVSTSQLVSELANRFGELPKKVTKALITDFLELIENEVVSGNKVRLDKLGIMQVKDRMARKGRNPQTGEEILIPASKKVGFRVAKSLKEAVTGPVRSARKTVKKK